MSVGVSVVVGCMGGLEAPKCRILDELLRAENNCLDVRVPRALEDVIASTHRVWIVYANALS